MPNFNTSDGELTDLFITNTDILDRYVGNQLWTWGSNSNGQLGNNTAISQSSPVQTVSSGTNWKLVSGGYYHTAAIKTDGTLWTWGGPLDGQLGNNSTIYRSSPVQTIAGGTNWQLVAGGGYHTAAIKTDGTLWTWGLNGNGQLGDNSIIRKSSPVQTVAGGTNWKQVASGGYHTAAIKTNGTLWLWGRSSDGQLGDNTAISKSSPVQTVAGGTNWQLVAGGAYFTAAIKTDGTLWLWGSNRQGQLGNNSTIHRSSPVQTVAGGTNWKQVAGGWDHTAAIKTNGTLWTWGFNSDGELGDNTAISKSSPIQTVASGTNWKQVSTNYHTATIKTDGTLWIWGYNVSRQLGDNTTIHRSSPVQTVAGGTNWKQVVAGYLHTMAIPYTES